MTVPADVLDAVLGAVPDCRIDALRLMKRKRCT